MPEDRPIRPAPDPVEEEIQRQRWEILEQFDDWMAKPMIVLSFVWLALLVVEFTRGLTPAMVRLLYAIWILFGIEFLIGFLLAPHRLTFLKHKWLTAISLMLPAFRVLRAFQALRGLQALRAARGVSLLRVVTSINRGMGALGRALAVRGVGYVIAVTLVVLFAGAAGMALFESPQSLREAGHAPVADAGGGLQGYGDALWWTAMMLTTVASEYWPRTPEGRILSWLLAVYALSIFGYIAANIASYFVGKDQREAGLQSARGAEAELARLREELLQLQVELNQARRKLATPPADSDEAA